MDIDVDTVSSFAVRVREVDPWGGWYRERTFLLGPRHTLADLALAIEGEFDREDQDHWHGFVFGGHSPRRREVMGALDEEHHGALREFLSDPWIGPDGSADRRITSEVRVAEVARAGWQERFQYWFDTGSTSRHDCLIEKRLVGRHPTPLRVELLSGAEGVPGIDHVVFEEGEGA